MANVTAGVTAAEIERETRLNRAISDLMKLGMLRTGITMFNVKHDKNCSVAFDKERPNRQIADCTCKPKILVHYVGEFTD